MKTENGYKTSFSIILFAAAAAWLIVVFLPYDFRRYCLMYYTEYANGLYPMPFWGFLFSPFIALILSGIITFVVMIRAAIGKLDVMPLLIINSYLFILALVHANSLVDLMEPSGYNLMIYPMLALMLIFGVCYAVSLKANEEKNKDMEIVDTPLLNQGISGNIDSADNGILEEIIDTSPKKLNPEIPKLQEGKARKQRIDTKIALTETLQKSAEDKIIL